MQPLFFYVILKGSAKNCWVRLTALRIKTRLPIEVNVV
jgi:hypothetical protein